MLPYRRKKKIHILTSESWGWLYQWDGAYCCVLDVLRAAEHVITRYFRKDGLMLPLKGRVEDTNRCGAHGRAGGFKENMLAPVSEQLQVCLSTSLLSCGWVRRIWEKHTGRKISCFKNQKTLVSCSYEIAPCVRTVSLLVSLCANLGQGWCSTAPCPSYSLSSQMLLPSVAI